MFTAEQLLSVPGLRVAVEAALDGGAFYETVVRDACKPAWETHLPAPENRLPELVVPNGPEVDGWQIEHGMTALAQANVIAGARGTWQTVRRTNDFGRTRWHAYMHDGSGEVYTHRGASGVEPTYAQVSEGMVSFEIYTARWQVTSERTAVANRLHGEALGLRAGMKLRNVTVAGVVYTSALVESFDATSGRVKFIGTRRGDKRRWDVGVLASGIDPASVAGGSPGRSTLRAPANELQGALL
jgi:hypothetical protein